MVYATDLFDSFTVRTFADRFVRILTSAVEDPSIALIDIPLTTDDERAQLQEWARGLDDADAPETLRDLIAYARVATERTGG